MSKQEQSATDQSLSRGMESVVLQDSEPLPPRGQPDERGDQTRPGPAAASNTGRTETSASMPMPGPTWEFNIFLGKLAEEISDDELDKLKALFIGQIGRGVLEKLTTTSKFFDHLRKLTVLDVYNLTSLQAILRQLNRPELIQMAADYAQKVGNTIYFRPPTEPLNGYRSVIFHVEGKDFQNCTQDFIYDLRSKLSRWLFVPAGDVLISGVEPSSSMLITIMIPEVYADVMETILKQNDAVQQLSELEIDTVKVGDNIYYITGIEGAEIVETEQQAKLVSVYQQLQDKTRQLDSIELELVTLEEEHKKLKQRCDVIEIECQTLRTLFNTTKYDNQTEPSALASQAALVEFRESLEKMKSQACDKSVIMKLLHANSAVMSNRSREACAIRMRHMQTQMQQTMLALEDVRSNEFPLQLEVLFHRTWSSGTANFDAYLANVTKLLQGLNVPQARMDLTNTGNEILKAISPKLRFKERQKLEKKYTWNPDDPLTKAKDADTNNFLSVLFYKELEKTKAFVDYVKFIEACLTEVKRPDLLQKFREMMTKPQPQSGSRAWTPPRQGAQPATTPSQPGEERLSRLEKHIEQLLTKVSGIENNISTAKNFGQTLDQPFLSKPFQSGEFGSFQPSNVRHDS